MSSLVTGPGPRRVIVVVCALVVAADQITKAICIANLQLHQRLPVIDGILDLTYVRNRGMAFGLFGGIEASWLRWALIGVALGAVAIIWSYARQERSDLKVSIAFGAILGGALGNLVDRVRIGYVVDFVLAHWGPHEWPAFNVADSAITIGGIVLFLTLARETSESPAEHAVVPAADQPPADPDNSGRDLD